jgi:hypothetical protein
VATCNLSFTVPSGIDHLYIINEKWSTWRPRKSQEQPFHILSFSELVCSLDNTKSCGVEILPNLIIIINLNVRWGSTPCQNHVPFSSCSCCLMVLLHHACMVDWFIIILYFILFECFFRISVHACSREQAIKLDPDWTRRAMVLGCSCKLNHNFQ